jgi:predicted small lipoprotein YifL
MKRILALLAMLALAFSLMACGGKGAMQGAPKTFSPGIDIR